MSNHVWVCFDCRQSVRRPSHDPDVRCPSCGAPCTRLGTKIEIPPKSKATRWKALRERFYRTSYAWASYQHRLRVRRTHELEREIARLSALPESEGLLARIRQLQSSLAEIRGT